MRVLTQVRELFRSLSNKHKKVKAYKTLEQFQLNEPYHEYPLVVLFTDTDSFNVTAYNPEGNEVSDEYVTVNFQVGIYTNQFEGYNVNDHQFEPVLNEVRRQTPNPEHTMIDDCSEILMDFVYKMKNDFEDNGFYQLIDFNWTPEQDITSDTVSGVLATFQLKWPINTCNYEDSFGDDNLSEDYDYKDN